MGDEKFIQRIEEMERGNIAERAAAIGIKFGGIEGDHHRAWTIDQMLRVLCGDDYENLVALYEQDGEYEWDEGIAP